MTQAAIHDPASETASRAELEQIQLERLQSTLNRAYRNVAFYRSTFDSHRVNLERIKSLKSLADLPFTTKEDLRRSYPYDMFAVPLRQIVRIHTASIAAGVPVVVGYTRNDLHNWTQCTSRLLTAAGIADHDVVQIALDYSLFAGAFGFHQGAEQIGASVIPASLTAGVDRQIAIMRDFKTTALITTPGHASRMAAALADMGVRLEQLHLRLGLFGGEHWGEGLRGELQDRLRIVATDTYGLADVMGPGAAGECQARKGLHVNEDHFIVEVIDPATLQPLGDGQAGELVFTTITREGFPLIRYRTGDITSLDRSPCPCGRTLARMSRVEGRTDQAILFRGVVFYPAQLESMLAQVEGATPHYQIVLDRSRGEETLEVRVEVSDAIPSLDELKVLSDLRKRIASQIKSGLELDATVTFAEPRSLRQAGSAQRVLDKRS
jgi:phenylacetate-CoA ligase